MREKLEMIYQGHRQGLYTLALSITRNPDRAEDAVHDAIVRLFRTNRQPTGDPVAYVFAAVRNAAIDIKRKRTELPMGDHWSMFESTGATVRMNGGGKHVSAGSTNGSRTNGKPLARVNGRHTDGHGGIRSDGDEPISTLLADETAQSVRDAVDELPEPQKQVLVMKLYGGLTFDEIAQANEEPLSTVASRYRRALEKLKDELQAVVNDVE